MKNLFKLLVSLIFTLTMYARADAQAYNYDVLVYDEPYQWNFNSTTDPASRITVTRGGCCNFQTGSISAAANTTTSAYAFRAVSAGTLGMVHEFTVSDNRTPSRFGFQSSSCGDSFGGCMFAYFFDGVASDGTRQIAAHFINGSHTTTCVGQEIEAGDKLGLEWLPNDTIKAYVNGSLMCSGAISKSGTLFEVGARFEPSSFQQTALLARELYFWPY